MAILPFFGSLLAQFYLTVTKPDGSPLPGVSVRILNTSNQDVTATLLPGSANLTNSFGIIQQIIPKMGVLPVGVYYFQLSLTGYEPLTFSDIGFTGAGKYAYKLSKAANSYAITPPAAVVSPLAPVEIGVSLLAGDHADRIDVRVSRTNGRSSTIVQLPDPDGSTVIDVRNRIRLSGPPALVAAGQTSSIDPGFADRVDLDVSTHTDSGEGPVGSTISLTAINIRPTSLTNDLSVYALQPAGGRVGKLIGPAVAFRGYYLDVIALLTKNPSANYLLSVHYLGGAGLDLAQPELIGLTPAPSAQRIRINTDAPLGTSRITAQAYDGNAAAISEPLTIAFRD